LPDVPCHVIAPLGARQVVIQRDQIEVVRVDERDGALRRVRRYPSVFSEETLQDLHPLGGIFDDEGLSEPVS
jgi:hypothetical protein